MPKLNKPTLMKAKPFAAPVGNTAKRLLVAALENRENYGPRFSLLARQLTLSKGTVEASDKKKLMESLDQRVIKKLDQALVSQPQASPGDLLEFVLMDELLVELDSRQELPARDNIPIASGRPSQQPSSDLEAKKKQLSDLLSKCAEIAGDHAELLNLVRKHPLLRHAGGPPPLYEPKQSRATTNGKSPGEVVEAVYTPPEGKYLRLDHLAHIDYRLYKLYNTWASRNGGHTIKRLISKSEYLALVVTQLKQLGYSEELLASVGVSLQQQKKRPRSTKKAP